MAPHDSWTLTAEALGRFYWLKLSTYLVVIMNYIIHESVGHPQFIEQQLNGKMPFIEDQLRAGCSKYHEHTVAVKDILHGKDPTAGWISVLQELPNVRSVFFIGPKYDPSRE